MASPRTTSIPRCSSSGSATPPPFCVLIRSREEGQACGEAVHEVLTPDRTVLSCAEAPDSRDRTQQRGHYPGVVVENAEQVRSAAVAAEEQRAIGRRAVEQSAEILVGGARVAYVELHGLADDDRRAHRDRARILVGAHH